jgi:hypothetical protein
MPNSFFLSSMQIVEMEYDTGAIFRNIAKPPQCFSVSRLSDISISSSNNSIRFLFYLVGSNVITVGSMVYT